MLRFDFSLYHRFRQLTALVDVRSVYGTSTEWAAKLRRNLLAHSEIPRGPFLLVATPERIFLWRDATGSDPLATPDYEVEAEPLFRSYLPKSGPAAELRVINAQTFELIVQSWLSDLMRGKPESVPTAFADSGFADTVRRGRIWYEEVA
jgi:hypothetical protein